MRNISIGTDNAAKPVPSENEEAFFLSVALRFGRPNLDLQYDLVRDESVFGSLYFVWFNKIAEIAGVFPDSYDDRAIKHKIKRGGVLYERYKSWYLSNESRAIH